MNGEPFGPLTLINKFMDLDEAVAKANRLRTGFPAYAYTRSSHAASSLAAGVETGMLSMNHCGLAFPEVPFGGA